MCNVIFHVLLSDDHACDGLTITECLTNDDFFFQKKGSNKLFWELNEIPSFLNLKTFLHNPSKQSD